MAVLVDLSQLTARRADRVLFEGLSVTVADGDRIGIVGINGTGKSTLLRVIAGVDAPEEGEVRRGRGARVGFLDQSPELPAGTVGEAVGEGWEAAAALDRLGMGAEAGTDVGSLSGGQAKRVALARVLAQPAELLVLDEPTNHLDLAAVAWLEERLASFRGGLVLVSHDRHLLDRLTTRMVELDRGHVHLHEGGYESYLSAKAEREERAATAESTRRNLARRELAWLRRGAQARSRKPQARVEAAKRLLAARPEDPARAGALDLSGGATKRDVPRLGDKVIELVNVSFRYGEGPTVLSGVDLLLGPGDRLGVVGANGTGKSTLVDLLAGRRHPTTGTVEVGPTVVVGTYDQHGVELDPQARVQDLVAGPHRSPGSLADVDLMRRYWFTGELPFARAGTLSGGERRRLQLLLVLAQRPNVLFLDEPTNDLDLDTLRVLEDELDDWPGSVVVVSHDRAFLERTTDRLVAVEEDGSVAAVPGGLDGWMARVEQRRGRGSSLGGPEVADDPTRGSSTSRSTLPGPSGTPPSGPPVERGEGGAGRVAEPTRGTASGTGNAPMGRLLRDAEKAMARHQRQRDKVAEALAATADHVELTRLGRELAEAQAALDQAEEHWLALAEEAESRR